MSEILNTETKEVFNANEHEKETGYGNNSGSYSGTSFDSDVWGLGKNVDWPIYRPDLKLILIRS